MTVGLKRAYLHFPRGGVPKCQNYLEEARKKLAGDSWEGLTFRKLTQGLPRPAPDWYVVDHSSK